MVAVVAPSVADEAVRRLEERGLPAWVLGSVGAHPDAVAGNGEETPGLGSDAVLTQGAKGVDGGTVALVGRHR
jgi:phosphoribosylformylglycinamidine cyclo-ligase